MNSSYTKFHLTDLLWDLWCLASIIGIWPRFIEPQLILKSTWTLPLPKLPPELSGLKIVQFSDLHLQANVSDHFLEKLAARLNAAQPDVLLFTGDFISHAKLSDKEAERLLTFLNKLKARYGCYAVLGNHDYASYVSVNDQGEYDVIGQAPSKSLIARGFARLFAQIKLTKKVTPQALAVGYHEKLMKTLKSSPFQVLHNENKLLKIKGHYFNVCGLGEYTLGKANAKQAFSAYQKAFPGIVLMHNPDGIPLIKDYPGDIIFCGHTHGGQVNLPGMWQKFTLLENRQFKRGLIHWDQRLVYVNRGVGSTFRFRWLAPPEILEVTLVAK